MSSKRDRLSATDQIQAALLERDYRLLRYVHVTDDGDGYGEEIARLGIYANGEGTLILEVYKDGGCELYSPLVESLSIDETVEAIPERRSREKELAVGEKTK